MDFHIAFFIKIALFHNKQIFTQLNDKKVVLSKKIINYIIVNEL